MNLKKSAQLFVAVILRRAIWNWIETYPSEFMRLCHSQKRLEGGPEILFDICNSLADTTRKKAVLWPLQTMLLILSPDVLLSSALSESRGVQNKKVQLSWKGVYVSRGLPCSFLDHLFERSQEIPQRNTHG